MVYAPDADVSHLYIEARREYVHAKGDQYSSQGVQPKMAVDASGNVVIQSLPKFTLDSPKLLMTKNKSTTLKVTEKSSDVARVEWSAQGSNGNLKIPASDENQVTVQSLGEISGSDSISYSVYDASGNLLINGFYIAKEKAKDEENTENGVWEINGVDYTAVFDGSYYVNKYPDVKAAVGTDLWMAFYHFLNYGIAEDRQGTGCKTLQGAVTVYNGVDYSAVFDYNYYISNNGDIKAAFGNDDVAVLSHFVNYGMSEGRRASEEFDVNVYKRNYSDLRSAFGNDLRSYYIHYMTNGKAEGRTAK